MCYLQPIENILYVYLPQDRSYSSNITLSVETVKWLSKMKHLGNIIRHDLNEIDDITRKTGHVIVCINSVNGILTSTRHSYFSSF